MSFPSQNIDVALSVPWKVKMEIASLSIEMALVEGCGRAGRAVAVHEG